MLSSIRLTPSSDSSRYAHASESSFDLVFEGLDSKQARTASQFGHDLMLGFPAANPEVRSNPLAMLEVDAQKNVAILARIFNDRFGNKIRTIKMIRSLFPGTGLKDSKDFVDFAESCTVIGSDELFCSNAGYKPDWIKF